MAAPSSTKWGTVRGSGNKQGRIGINITYSDTATTRKVTIAIWYWTRYRVQDSGNTFKYGWGNSANTSIGSKSINTTSNSSWSTTNQVLIGSYSKTYNKGTSASTQYASASFESIEYGGGSGSYTASFSIPALASYKITYNANGGTSVPSGQTKWYGKNITLSSSKPTRTGYTFLGWNTSSTATSANSAYNPGATYTGNSNLTLYAVWKAVTYTVTYNANGGSGAPGNQTKTYGVNLTLSSTKPTRTNYNFKGWATSSTSTAVAYAAGSVYKQNSNISLYAVWELAYTIPRITNLTADRCNSSGTLTEEGKYALVKFNWATDKTVTSIKIEYRLSTSTGTWSSVTVSASGTGGVTASKIIGGSFDIEKEYSIRVTVADSVGSNNNITSVAPITYEIDFLNGGGGVTIGRPAEKKGFNVHMDSEFNKSLKVQGKELSTLILCQKTEPTNQTDGSIWFQEV